MARIKYFKAFDIEDTRVDGEDITIANARLVRQNDGFDRIDYRGSFNISGTAQNLDVSGTLQALTYFQGGQKILSISGINRDAARAATLIENENSRGFVKFLASGPDNATLSSGDDRIKTFGGNDRIVGKAGDDVLLAGGGADKVIGNGGDDRAVGQGGSDLLKGNGGDDLLQGSGGDDRLIGGGGSDVIDGGRGDDVCKGGGGADTFRYRKRDGDDEIIGFRQGQDEIEILSGARGFKQLDIEDVKGGALISFAATSIFIDNGKAGEFTADDFIF